MTTDNQIQEERLTRVSARIDPVMTALALVLGTDWPATVNPISTWEGLLARG
ncbi:MAG TPA: hypothetical protein VGL60_13735 [Acidimicrobiales bacterium]